jgi:hypothetical protein
MSTLLRRELTDDDYYFLDDYRVELEDPGIVSDHSMRLRGSTEKKTNASWIAYYEKEMMRRGISRNFNAYTRKLTQAEFETL